MSFWKFSTSNIACAVSSTRHTTTAAISIGIAALVIYFKRRRVIRPRPQRDFVAAERLSRGRCTTPFHFHQLSNAAKRLRSVCVERIPPMKSARAYSSLVSAKEQKDSGFVGLQAEESR